MAAGQTCALLAAAIQSWHRHAQQRRRVDQFAKSYALARRRELQHGVVRAWSAAAAGRGRAAEHAVRAINRFARTKLARVMQV